MGTILMPFMRRSAPEALKPRTRLATEASCRPWRLSISSTSDRKTRNRRQQCGAPPHSPVLSCIVWARLSPGYKLRPARAGHGFTMVTRGTGRLFALFVICPLSPASCPPTDLCVHGDTTSLSSSLPTLCMTRSDAG